MEEIIKTDERAADDASAERGDEQLKWTRPEGRKRVVFSGMQPTGALHLGNYLGALVNWINCADDPQYDCIYSIVDYHAITIPYDVSAMRRRVLDMARDMIAGGLPIDKCSLFAQSHAPEHAELAWIFCSLAMMGRLENMTQFKDKSKLAEQREGTNAGLFVYPVLQAADILLYKGELVPVGEDQEQHLELSREIARRFNFRYGPTFPEPKTMFSTTPRIMGLDGARKMSKSLDNHVGLLEEPASVIEKFTRRAASDPSRARRKDPGNPDVCYVYSMHKFFTPDADREQIACDCRSAAIGCFDCKKKLAENVISKTEPMRERAREVEKDDDYVWDVLHEGAKRAKAAAEETMAEVKGKMGLLPPWGNKL